AHTPTSRSPAPSAYTISVMDGASETMRAGAPAGDGAGAGVQPPSAAAARTIASRARMPMPFAGARPLVNAPPARAGAPAAPGSSRRCRRRRGPSWTPVGISARPAALLPDDGTEAREALEA